MALQIVWRNPEPLARNKPTVLKIEDNRFCAVYVVRKHDGRQEFWLMSGEAA
jgi:hypothetical protein